MGITVTLRGGSGDMLKSTYDSDLDGVIAVAQTAADMTKAAYDTNVNGKIDGDKYTPPIIAGDNLIASCDTERYQKTNGWHKVKSIKVLRGGTYRVKFEATNFGGGTDEWEHARIYKNGVVHGVDHQTTQAYVVYSDDLLFTDNDEIQLYVKSFSNTIYGQVKNFRLYRGTLTHTEEFDEHVV